MNYTCILFGIVFTVSGTLFAFGRGYLFRSVFAAVPEAEKEKIRLKRVCRNVGEVIVLNGLIFLMRSLCTGFSSHAFTYAMIAWLVVAGMDVVYITKNERAGI